MKFQFGSLLPRNLLILSAISLNLLSCGGGGGGEQLGGGKPSSNVPASIVSGSVQAPNGLIAFSTKQNLLDKFANIIIPAANALMPGISPVPDGTIVELDRINESGTVIATITTTTTSGGTYSFNFTKLGLSFSSDLVVRVSNLNSGAQMRAFVGIGLTNINPVSEAILRMVLNFISSNPVTALANFTPQEQNDLVSTADLLTTLNQLTPGLNIESTVLSIISAVSSDAGVMAFLTSSSGTGQTNIGPGDIGNYFPNSFGNTWVYQSTNSQSPGATSTFTTTDSFTGTKVFNGLLTSVLTETKSNQTGQPLEDYSIKNSTGDFEYGDNDTTDFLLPLIAPVQHLIFPIQPGRSFGQISKTGLNYGRDLDGDGVPETFDFTYKTTYINFETVNVPSGIFPNSIKMTINSTATITLSKSKKLEIITITENVWLAPRIGMVKNSTSIQGQFNGSLISSELDSDELTGYVVDHTGKGLRIEVTPFNPAVGINSAQQFTALAFDQANNPIYGLTYNWNSSPTAVATINGNGLATGLAYGMSTVTASAMGIASNPAQLTVTAQTPTFGGIISAQPIDMGSIKLTWGPVGGSLRGIPPNQLVFSICYSPNPNVCLTQFVPLYVNPPASVDSNGNYNYSVTLLKPETTYYFVIKVQDPLGNRDSNTAVATATTKPGKLYVSDFTNNQILRFDHPSLLNQNPPIAESIQAAQTISGPTCIFLNNSRDINGIQKDRLYIANFSNNSIVVLDGASSVSGNVNSAITKIITSSALQSPVGMYVDTSQSREWIYVVNSVKDSTGMFAVIAFDVSLCPTNTVTCNMDAVPNGMRIIHSNDFNQSRGIWVDEGLDSFNQSRDILFISNRGLSNSSSPGNITMFNNASTLTGMISATKIIQGNMTSLLGPVGLFMDSLKDQLYVTNMVYNDILVFNQPQNCSVSQIPNICNIIPDRTIFNIADITHPFDAPSSLAINFSGDQLYLADLGLYTNVSSLMVLNQASIVNGQATISSYMSSASLINAPYQFGQPESIALDSTR